MNKQDIGNYLKISLLLFFACVLLTGCMNKTIKVNSADKATTVTPATVSSNPSIDPTEAPDIQSQMDDYLQKTKFQGTVLISQHNKICFEKSFGLANIESNASNQNTTIYAIGSDTKQFVATGILLLQEEGKLSIKDPISKYLPDFKNGDKVTIKNLLNMNSGITDFLEILGQKGGLSDFIFKDYETNYVYNLVKDRKLTVQPSENKPNVTYSNTNYYLLAKIIDVVTGESYEDYLTEKILVPLNMKNTSFDMNNCTGLGYLNGKPTKRVSKELTYGCGAMTSTADDLILWVNALMSGKVLSSKSMDIMFDGLKYPDTDTRYGCGWMINGEKRMHGGSVPGYNSMIFYHTKSDLSIICLSNVHGVTSQLVVDYVNSHWK